ncbi:MAG TPA: NAD(P)/FAD-dependent oxidoreductase [Phenylobacterium sp.]|jgi:pyruvate/2-oxoglutarate dehydrogenase complex dihydrolipoamide dehydrogenase (E3) component
MTDVLVVGAGPAGVAAATRAAQLGARTTLATSGAFGGMAANDGPVPVRTLAHAARLIREARQLSAYGIAVGEPCLDYSRLLARVAEVVAEVGVHSALRPQAEAAGVVIREHVGPLRFVAADTLATAGGERFRADRIILCTGGVSRRLGVPGAELVATHSDAWSLTAVPGSMLVIGAGATGLQVASVFNAFGTRVQLFQSGPRIIPTEDEDVSASVAESMRRSGVEVHENFGAIERFEPTPGGIRMIYARDGKMLSAEADLAVAAIGWTAETADLNLAAAGVGTNARGFIAVDEFQRTAAARVWAAGDVTGGLMLAPQATQAGFAAATNAVTGEGVRAQREINPIGSFTDPEYAQVGLSEAGARAGHDVETVTTRFESLTRGIVDGRTVGFCKLIVDRADHRILGCHVVGDRAVDTAQIAAVAMAGGLSVDTLARLPLSFPTYAGVLARAAASAAYHLNNASAAQAAIA